MSNKSEQYYQNIKPKPSESFYDYMLRKQLLSLQSEQTKMREEIEDLKQEKRSLKDQIKILYSLILALFGGIVFAIQMFVNPSKYTAIMRVGFVLITTIWLFAVCLIQLHKSKNKEMFTLLLVGAYSAFLIVVVLCLMLF